MVHALKPATEIIFLDTGGHFPETLSFAAEIESAWKLNMTRTHTRSGRRRVALWHRELLRTAQSRAPRSSPGESFGVDYLSQARRRPDANSHENPDVG